MNGTVKVAIIAVFLGILILSSLVLSAAAPNQRGDILVDKIGKSSNIPGDYHYNSRFISWNPPPDVMTPGQKYNVTVTMKNTGYRKYWYTYQSRLTFYSRGALGFYDPSHDITKGSEWGVNEGSRWALTHKQKTVVFIDRDSHQKIKPDEIYTYNFNITAPNTPGRYLFRWKTVYFKYDKPDDYLRNSFFFGEPTPEKYIQVIDTTTPPGGYTSLDATFISQQVPSIVEPGKKYIVSLTFKNTGDINWTSGLESARFVLQSQNPQSNNYWGMNKIYLDAGEVIEPGNEKTFNFEMTAPTLSGTQSNVYNFQWQMYKEDQGVFGEKSENLAVTVTCTDPDNNGLCDSNEQCSDGTDIGECNNKGQYCEWIEGEGARFVSGKNHGCICPDGTDYVESPYVKVVNYNFEDSEVPGQFQNIEGSQGYYRYNNRLFHSPQHSLEIVKTNSGGLSRLTIPIELESGTYDITAWVNSDHSAAARIGIGDKKSDFHSGNGRWEKLTLTHVTSSGASMNLDIEVSDNKAFVYFDDIIVTKYDFTCNSVCAYNTENGTFVVPNGECMGDEFEAGYRCIDTDPVLDPQVCGCPEGQKIADDGECRVCTDGTQLMECSTINQGKLCSSGAVLVDNAGDGDDQCPCADGFTAVNGVCVDVCNSNGVCEPWEIDVIDDDENEQMITTCEADCSVTFNEVLAETTQTGVTFSFNINPVLRTVIVCNANATIDECEADFNKNTAECTGDSCYCGKSVGSSCDYKCNDKELKYYFYASGRMIEKEFKVRTADNKINCPRFRFDEVNDYKEQFKTLDNQIDLQLNMIEYDLGKDPNNPDLLKQKDLHEQASILVKTHRKFIDENLVDLTREKSELIIARSIEVLALLNQLLGGNWNPSDIVIKNVFVQPTIRINTTGYVKYELENLKNTLYTKLQCSVTDPYGDSLNIWTDCTSIENGEHQLNMPVYGSLLGIWNVDYCTFLTSSLKGCSSLVFHSVQPHPGNFTVVPPLPINATALISDDVVSEGVRAGADVNIDNPDTSDRYVKALCTFESPNGSIITGETSCKTVGAGEDITLSPKIKFNELGQWKVPACAAIQAVDNKCEYASKTINISDVGSINVKPGRVLIIGKPLTLPNELVDLGDTITVGAKIMNIGPSDTYAYINCTLTDPKNRRITRLSDVKSVSRNGSLAFTVDYIMNVAGIWIIDSCNTFRDDISPKEMQGEISINRSLTVKTDAPVECTRNLQCKGIDTSCECSDNACVGCPTGYYCTGARCEPRVTQPPKCGNGLCDADETSITCNKDCKEVQPIYPECRDVYDCRDKEDCVNNECKEKLEFKQNKPILPTEAVGYSVAIIIIVLIIIIVGLLMYRRYLTTPEAI